MSRIKPAALIFDYETTTRTDFREGAILPLVTTKHKPKRTCYRIRHSSLKDLNTLTEWKGPIVPFNLYWKKKEIIRELPLEPQAPFIKPEDQAREEVQKTRPRLVMTPAASLDDVPEPAREHLLSSIYATSKETLMRGPIELANRNCRVKAPLPTLPAPADPLAIKPLQPPYVSPEWRMDSAAWVRDSLRSYADPTREFWLRARKDPCSVCDQTLLLEAQRKMLRGLKKSR